jgi:FKBP-type peptidyl-prolyl cis-trans isomerase FklB
MMPGSTDIFRILIFEAKVLFMKKPVVLLLMLSLGLPVFSQKGKTPPKVVPKTNVPVLKTALDSFSYAVGMSIALQYKEFGVTTLNTTAVMNAVNDVLKNKNFALTTDQANYVLNNYINALMTEKASENKNTGAVFLASNKNKPGIITLPSGLQYQVVRQGSGPKPKSTDTVTVHYTGTLIDGKVFDSSVDRGVPAKFTVGGVIAGWTEALQLMPVGSRWKLFIPAELGYGNYSPPGSNIPPGATLIFDLELLSIGGGQ